MPHIVLSDKIDLHDFQKSFRVIIKKDPLIKITDVFLNKDYAAALAPALIIDEKHMEFFIEILTRENKTTVRLYPQTDPEKTDNVKRSMGLLAEEIMRINPNLEIVRTNIGEFLPESMKLP